MRALVGAQRLPVAHRRIPVGALRRLRAALEVFEGLLVRRDQAGAGAALDRHVADRHAAFHRQRTDRLAGIFQHIAGAAGGADLADDGQDDVLAGDAVGQLAVDHRAHVLGLLLDQRLRRQHVLDFRGADAVGQRAERAMRRGVAVAADDGGAGQREALLGADDVDDALALVELVEIFDAEFAWRSRPAPRSARCFPDRDWAWCGRWSGRCGRRRRASFPARAPCGRWRAGLRRPAARSPRAPDGGRYRAGRCRHRLRATRWSFQILSYRVVGLDMSVSSKMKFCEGELQARIRARAAGRQRSIKLRSVSSDVAEVVEASEEPAGQPRAIVDDDAARRPVAELV